MPSLRLTRRVIDELPHPSAGQVYYRDTTLPGFGLRVGARSKVYFAEGQVHGRTRRVTIGRADVFAPEVARKRAQALLGDMAEGTDPNEQKRTQRTDRVTVSAAFERFFEARTALSPYTVSSYQRTARLYLKSWNKTPLAAITRPMVLKKHQQLAAAHGETTANNAMRHLRSVYNFIAATEDESRPRVVLAQEGAPDGLGLIGGWVADGGAAPSQEEVDLVVQNQVGRYLRSAGRVGLSVTQFDLDRVDLAVPAGQTILEGFRHHALGPVLRLR